MKVIAPLALAAALSGCVAYSVPVEAPHVYGGPHPGPVYYGGAPYVVNPPAVVVHRPRYHRRDLDRDGDGVPNRIDRWPDDPRRR